ncbi:hypothetical protein NP493_377g01014 [Ridgeia piscesae]|uniref:Uncharacterized protein n=2 Tax=Ridgeia piscesae TaxID=27915 RepID=A0AAD9L2J4_RIDPI|nr:hypothetical protein NP493_377g01014 [Ridgeia piscesae]
MDSNHTCDVCYKVLLLGESGVGKTAMIRSIIGLQFDPESVPTIGIDFARKTFEVDGAKVKFEIWDTAGQERFRTITRFQFRGTKGVLLMYDVTNKKSFSKLKYWLDCVDQELDQQNKEPVPVFIIGNKCDLDEQRQVTAEMGEKMAESSYVHGFMETSARDNTNVQQAFHQLAEAMTEINHPKLLNAYLCPMERRERDTRRMAAVLSTRPSNRYSISLNRPAKKRKHKCAC